MEEIKARDTAFINELQYSESTDDQIIKLNFDENQCNIETPCLYCVAVWGNAESGESGYVLTAKHDKMHTILREGYHQVDEVELGAFNYYKFSLANADEVEEIIFKVNPIYGGEVTMMVDRQNQFPDINSREKYSFWGEVVYSM